MMALLLTISAAVYGAENVPILLKNDHQPAIVSLSNGEWLCLWYETLNERDRPSHDYDRMAHKCNMVYSRSSNNGKKWAPPRALDLTFDNIFVQKSLLPLFKMETDVKSKTITVGASEGSICSRKGSAGVETVENRDISGFTALIRVNFPVKKKTFASEFDQYFEASFTDDKERNLLISVAQYSNISAENKAGGASPVILAAASHSSDDETEGWAFSALDLLDSTSESTVVAWISYIEGADGPDGPSWVKVRRTLDFGIIWEDSQILNKEIK